MSWRTVSLGEVANVGAGNSAPQEDRLFENGTHNFYRTSDVGRIRTGVISESSDKLNSDGIRGLKLHSIGTILFPKSGASTFLNHRVMLGKEGYVSSHLATIKAKADVANDKFLLYFLSTIDAKNLVQDSNYPSLKTSVIEKIIFSLPPLTTQQKIVAKLDAIFAEIDKATAAAEANAKNAEVLWQSVIDKVISDFHNREIKVFLSEVVKIVSKLVDPKEDKFKEFLHIGAGNIISNTGELCDLRTAKEENLISGKFIFDGDTVLYSKIRPYLKKVAKPNFIGLCSADVYPLVCVDGKLTKDFLFYLLLSSDFTNYAISGSERAGMPKVNREHLFAYEFNLPSVPEQESLTKIINAVYDLNESMNKSFRKKIEDLSCLKQSILRKAFTGQLVKD